MNEFVTRVDFLGSFLTALAVHGMAFKPASQSTTIFINTFFVAGYTPPVFNHFKLFYDFIIVYSDWQY